MGLVGGEGAFEVDAEPPQDADAYVLPDDGCNFLPLLLHESGQLILPVDVLEDLLRFEVGEYFEVYFDQDLMRRLLVVGQLELDLPLLETLLDQSPADVPEVLLLGLIVVPLGGGDVLQVDFLEQLVPVVHPGELEAIQLLPNAVVDGAEVDLALLEEELEVGAQEADVAGEFHVGHHFQTGLPYFLGTGFLHEGGDAVPLAEVLPAEDGGFVVEFQRVEPHQFALGVEVEFFLLLHSQEVELVVGAVEAFLSAVDLKGDLLQNGGQFGDGVAGAFVEVFVFLQGVFEFGRQQENM